MINYKKEKEDENEMSQEDNVTEKIPLYPNKEYLEEDSFFSKKSLRQIRKARSELNIQDDIFIIVKETHRIYGVSLEGHGGVIGSIFTDKLIGIQIPILINFSREDEVNLFTYLWVWVGHGIAPMGRHKNLTGSRKGHY